MLHRRRDGDELIGNRLHRRPKQLRRLRAQRKAGNDRARLAVPVRAPLTGPVRKNRQAMAVGRKGARRAFEFFFGSKPQVIGEPAHHVAALAQRPAEHVAVAVDAIDEGSPGHGQARPIDQHTQGARGPNGGACPARTDAPGAEVGQTPVAEREIPGRIAQLRPTTVITRAQRTGWLIPFAEWRELFRCDAGQPEGGLVPLAAIDIEQPGPGRDRIADAGLTVELLVEVFAQRDPPHRPTHGGGAGGAQPAELRRPVAGMKETAGARVVGALVETRAHGAGFPCAARVGPGEELGGRPASAIDTHQAVPVAGDTDAQDGDLLFARRLQRTVDALRNELDQRVRIRGNLTRVGRANFVWKIGQGLLQHRSARVVDDGADGGGPEVERENAFAGCDAGHS